MSNLNNETLLEQLYDEAWIDYAVEHNLTQDQLFAIEQDSEYGVLPEIEAEARRRFEDLIQWWHNSKHSQKNLLQKNY